MTSYSSAYSQEALVARALRDVAAAYNAVSCAARFVPGAAASSASPPDAPTAGVARLLAGAAAPQPASPASLAAAMARCTSLESAARHGTFPALSLHHAYASCPEFADTLGRWRQQLIAWLARIATHFSLPPACLPCAVALADRVLASSQGVELTSSSTQLLFAASLCQSVRAAGLGPELEGRVRAIAAGYTAEEFGAATHALATQLAALPQPAPASHEPLSTLALAAAAAGGPAGIAGSGLRWGGFLDDGAARLDAAVASEGGLRAALASSAQPGGARRCLSVAAPLDGLLGSQAVAAGAHLVAGTTPLAFACALAALLPGGWWAESEAARCTTAAALLTALREHETTRWSPWTVATAAVILGIRAAGQWYTGPDAAAWVPSCPGSATPMHSTLTPSEPAPAPAAVSSGSRRSSTTSTLSTASSPSMLAFPGLAAQGALGVGGPGAGAASCSCGSAACAGRATAAYPVGWSSHWLALVRTCLHVDPISALDCAAFLSGKASHAEAAAKGCVTSTLGAMANELLMAMHLPQGLPGAAMLASGRAGDKLLPAIHVGNGSEGTLPIAVLPEAVRVRVRGAAAARAAGLPDHGPEDAGEADVQALCCTAAWAAAVEPTLGSLAFGAMDEADDGVDSASARHLRTLCRNSGYGALLASPAHPPPRQLSPSALFLTPTNEAAPAAGREPLPFAPLPVLSL